MNFNIENNLKEYAAKRNLSINSCLGHGTQGSVYVCDMIPQSGQNLAIDQSAVKVHDREVAYQREIAVYERLQNLNIIEVCGHMVPQLVHFDDELLAIEMTIVSPPFCLDFGGAYLDKPPDYSPEVWRDWEQMKSEDFEENWPKVKEILRAFESFGVYIADVNPGNIKFI